MYDPMEDIGRNLDEIGRSAGAFQQAGRSMRPVTATDGSGAVTVTLDADGRISSVVVASRWTDSYSPDTLAAGINEAMTTAGATRLEQWGTAAADPQTAVEATPGPLPHENLAERLRGVVQEDRSGSAEETMAALRSLLHELNESIEQVTQDVDAHLSREYSARSPSGHARVTLAGNGTLLTLTLDRDWLERAHPTNIGREATQAIHAAYQRIASEGTETIVGRSVFGRLQSLSEDPVALARELRLRD